MCSVILFVIVCFCLGIIVSCKAVATEVKLRLTTAHEPVSIGGMTRVKAFRHKSNNTISWIDVDAPVRSKAALFQQALGLKAGTPFLFSIDRWRAVQHCGLYRSLSAKGKTHPDTGEVVMEISGQELPSIRFTPEVSVGASLTNPEASGGVAFEDRNFLGMGQKVEFAVAKKEGQQAGLAELPPSITAKWSDSNVGRPSKVSVGFNEQHTFLPALDQVPGFMLGTKAAGRAAGAQLTTMYRKLYLCVREDIVVTGSGDGADAGREGAHVLGRLGLSLSPYRSTLSSAAWSRDGDTRREPLARAPAPSPSSPSPSLALFSRAWWSRATPPSPSTSAQEGVQRLGAVVLHGAELHANWLSSGSRSGNAGSGAGWSANLDVDDGQALLVKELARGEVGGESASSASHRFTSVKGSVTVPMPHMGSIDYRYPEWLCQPLERMIFYVPNLGSTESPKAGDTVLATEADADGTDGGGGGGSGSGSGSGNGSGRRSGGAAAGRTVRSIGISGRLRAHVGNVWGGGAVPHFHSTDLGDERIMRGAASGNKAASFAGAQADVYVEGLIKGAVVGVFVDGAAVGGGGGGRSKGSTESQGAAISGVDAWNNACTDMLQRARGLGRKSAVGMSVRAKGLRADVGWAGGHSTPRLYIGVDDQ